MTDKSPQQRSKMHILEYVGISVIIIGFVLMLLPKVLTEASLPPIVDKYAFFTSGGLLLWALGSILRSKKK